MRPAVLALLLLLAASLGLNVAAAVIPGVARDLGRAVQRVTGRPSVESRYQSHVEDLEQRLAGAQAELAADRAARQAEAAERGDAERAAKVAEQRLSAAIAAAEAARAAAVAASRISYRGFPSTPAEAVADTADRLAALTLATSTASASSAYAEALPIIGIGVIAANTGAQVDANCQIMAALGELNTALNPGRPVPADARAVCAIEGPTRDDLWTATTRDPAALWTDARSLHPELPALDLGPQWQSAAGMWQALYDWAYPSPAGPPDAAGQGPAGPPAALTPGEWQ